VSYTENTVIVCKTGSRIISYYRIKLNKDRVYRRIGKIIANNLVCETWSLTLREERKLKVFENMVLRRIFGPRRDEVTGEWRRLHNEEINDLYS